MARPRIVELPPETSRPSDMMDWPVRERTLLPSIAIIGCGFEGSKPGWLVPSMVTGFVIAGNGLSGRIVWGPPGSM